MGQLAEFYEREYRGDGSSIPNYMKYFDDWREQSDLARQQFACHLDVPYGQGEKETLDLFPAPNSQRLLIFLHGGYWHSMDKSDYSCIAPAFLKAGISVAVPNYALCPNVSMPTIVDQCRRAIAWLYHHAPDYQVNADQLIVTGHSAGGHLTAMMYATDWEAHHMPSQAIVGGVALSGLYDLDPFLMLTLNDMLRLDASTARLLSPLYLQPHVNAPLITAVGALESNEFKRQNQAICDVWQHNCRTPLILDGIHHFNILDVLTDLDSPIWQANPSILGTSAPL